MATLESIIGIVDIIKHKVVDERKSYSAVSEELKRSNPAVTRGLSARSVRRFCQVHDIHASSRLSDVQLDRVVRSSVAKVDPTYGRKMVTGFLTSQGIRCSEKRIGASLRRVSSAYHSARMSNTHRQTNPVPYSADYFGQKVHIDQNEKLVMFGVTHVCAVDGFSGKIVAFVTMPRKNNILVYKCLYMKMVPMFGLWDQIRVDKGCEWYLMLYINKLLSHLRGDTSRPPHLQTSSKMNHTIERLWVEVNSRVNYPVKQVLVEMLESGEICLENTTTQFCVSWFSLKVCSVGVAMFVASWNSHPIPGQRRGLPRGVPDILYMQNNRARKIPQTLLPLPEQASEAYRNTVGVLTDPSPYGRDPLDQDATKNRLRLQAFHGRFPSFDPIFYDLVNGNSTSFKEAVLFFIDITRRMSCT